MIPHVKEFNTNGCSRIDDWYFSELTIKSSFYQKNTVEKIDIQKKNIDTNCTQETFTIKHYTT